MAGLPAELHSDEEVTALKLARDIAMDFHDVDAILEAHGITGERYEQLKSNPYFRALLASEVAAWKSALNTNERVKLKAASMLEEWLPEAYARAHDAKETLSAKVELMKLIKSLTGMGVTNATEGGGERLSVTINLGGDAKLTYEKTVAPQVIDGEVLPSK
jgi:hypothetical protein